MTDGLSLLKKMNKDATMYDSATQMKDQAWEMREADIEDTTQNDEEITRIREQLVQQLMVDTQSAQDLATKYPHLMQMAQNEQARLQTDASRTGAEKRENDLFATKKVSAKWRLWRNESKKKRLEEKRYGKELEVKQREGKMHDYFTDQFNGYSQDFRTEDGKEIHGRRSPYMTEAYSKIYGNPFMPSAQTTVTERSGATFKLTRDNVEFPMSDSVKLRGACFTPEGFDIRTNKVVIYFTGSGEPGRSEAGVGDTIDNYVRAGFKVYQVDYRGYGSSDPRDGFTFSEAGFCQDGEFIYNKVKEQLGCNDSDLILHGYSMGGAIASYVAGKVAQKAAKDAHGKENVQSQNKLGGLVMDSPMASMNAAVENTTSGFIKAVGPALATHYAGSYSAEEHLGTLFQNQPDIPIMFVSGGDSDHLALERTGIHEKYSFDSQSFTRVTSHFDCHMTEDMLSSFMAKHNMTRPHRVPAPPQQP